MCNWLFTDVNEALLEQQFSVKEIAIVERQQTWKLIKQTEYISELNCCEINTPEQSSLNKNPR